MMFRFYKRELISKINDVLQYCRYKQSISSDLFQQITFHIEAETEEEFGVFQLSSDDTDSLEVLKNDLFDVIDGIRFISKNEQKNATVYCVIETEHKLWQEDRRVPVVTFKGGKLI